MEFLFFFLNSFYSEEKNILGKKKINFFNLGGGEKKATGQSTILHRFLRNEHNMRRLLPWSEFCG